jgi:HlyD family secretion protein
VSKLHADFNDRVHPGQVLVELDDALFRAQVKQSEASVGNARAALDLAVANEARVRELHRQGIVSRQELDQAVEAAKSARAQLALAQAQLQKDRTNLGYTVIRSPVSGVVVDRQVDVGQTVAASFQTPTLFLIAQDLTKMQIDSSFAEADIGNIRVGQPVRFTVDAFPNRPFQGTVKMIRLNPVTQQNVVTYDVVVAVDNPDQILLPGMTAYVNVVVARRQGVLTVPNAALRFRPVEPAQLVAPQEGREEKREGPTATVYTLEGDPQRGQLRRVTIVPGITDNRSTEVVSGEIKPGARVVVEERQAAAPASTPTGTFRIRLF